MKFTRPRTVLAGIIAAAAVAVPISLTVALPGTGPTVASPASPPPPDTVVYAEGKGSSSNFISYTDGKTGAVTTQAVTSGGGCSSPTIHGVPLLNLAGYVYTYGTQQPNPPNASVGAYQGRTGVCGNNLPGSGQPNYAINNGSNSANGPAEALDFGIGSNNLTVGREFTNALLNIQSQSGPSAGSQITLVESLNGAPVSTQTCPIASGATITADTSLKSGPCIGNPAAPFDDVEIQVTTPNASVSVTGPTSTFTLEQQACPGDAPIPAIGTTTGVDSATLSVAATAGGCKSYSGFTYTSDNGQGSQEVDFNAASAGPILFTETITWAPDAQCEPGACPATMVSYPGQPFYAPPHCAAPNLNAVPPVPVCITNAVYNYQVNGGVAQTQITETITSDIDLVSTHH
jgi:hypothetical protein